MPPASALPDSIRRLSRIQAFELTDRRWDWDVDQLAAMIASHIPALDHFFSKYLTFSWGKDSMAYNHKL
jgi:hypothetical protein